MSRRRSVLQHQRQLQEIRDIMNAMKNLAYLETRKIARYLANQRAITVHIQTVAKQLLHCFPELRSAATTSTSIIIATGAEHGFCGAFNDQLIHAMTQILPGETRVAPSFIIIGYKLGQKLRDDARVAGLIEGASIAEEIDSVLDRVVDKIISLHREDRNFEIKAVFHDPDALTVRVKHIFPPFMDIELDESFPSGMPAMNLPPRELFRELADQYLFAALYEIAYLSFMAENQSRLEHLDQATNQIDNRLVELKRRSNALRQEEIIEEIEVILVNSTVASSQSWP